MKQKIIEILKSQLEDCETQAGVKGRIIWEEDFDTIASDLVKLFDIPDSCFTVDKSKADKYNTSDMCVQLYNCKCGNTDLFESDKYCSDCGIRLMFK